MKSGPKNKEEFLALIVRRKWWIIVPFVGISIALGLLTSLLPSTYVSEALILVRQRDVSEEYVVDLIAGTSQERLASIEQIVRSRTNLVQIVQRFEDRHPRLAAANMDERVDFLNSQIEIEPLLQGNALTSFRIFYQDQNAELAQEIASELTTLFLQQDDSIREDQVIGTTDFLSAELEEARAALEASDLELEALRRQYQTSLPETMEANQRQLDRLVDQSQTNEEALDRGTTRLLTLQQQLSETSETLSSGELPTPLTDPILEEYAQARAAVDALVDRGYTSEHPQLMAAQRRLERLEEQLPPETDANSTPEPQTAPINPQYQNLRAQIAETETDLRLLENRRALLESDIERYQGYVQRTFSTEPVLAEAFRRNTSLRESYDGLQTMLDEASLSESLELRQQGGQFQVIDSANLPLSPTKPNRPVVLFGAIVLCLALSIGFAVVVDVARQKIWTQSEIENLWGVPVLVDIPEIVTDSDLAGLKKKQLTIAVSSLGGAVVYVSVLYLVYLNHESILSQLDPILQRLVY